MIRAYVETFNKYKYLLQNLISRDFKVKYRRSVLGVAWSLLNPVLMMLILSAVFSKVLRFDTPNFPLYVMTGQIVFLFFNESTTSANYSIVDSAQLIKKVYIPKYLFPIEKILFGFVNMLFSLIAIFIMLLIFGIPFNWSMLLFPVPLIALLMFTLGFGLILSALCVFFRDLKHLYSVLIMAWLYLTPIIYPLEAVAGSWIKYIVLINPLTWFVEYFRSVILYIPISFELPFSMLHMNLVCFGWGVAMLLVGFVLFHKTQDKFILYI